MSEKVLLLHGFGGRPSDFDRLREHLSAEWNPDSILCPDLYRLEGVDPTLSLKDWVGKFADWIRSQQVQSLFVVGYSMGGRLALNLLTTELSAMIKNVVCLSSRPGVWDPDDVAKRERFDLLMADKFRTLTTEEMNFEWQNLVVFQNTSPADLRGDVGGDVLAENLLQWSPRKHLFSESDLVNLQMKIFWFYGDNDRVYHPIVQWIDKSQMGITRVISGAGHRVLSDAPLKVAAHIRNLWLAGEL